MPRARIRNSIGLLGLSSALLAFGCVAPDDPGLVLDCESGQCDLFGGIRDLREDVSRVDKGDIFAVTSDLASDALNQALRVGDFSLMAVRPTELFALSEDAEDDLTLRDIDELVSGLAARYGETNLTYEVNRIRRDHLLQSDDDYYAEAAFRMGPELDPSDSWHLDVGGIEDAEVRVGFDYTNTTEARVIVAVEKESQGYLEAPLATLAAARGHVLPKSSDDVLGMKPGELFALSSRGSVALNVGAGVPIFAVDPGSLSYKVAFNAALRTRIRGDQMDTQLIRMEGNDVVVDVGISDVKGVEAQLAIRDGWGVAGLLGSRCDEGESEARCRGKLDVTVGSVDVNLGDLADKALRHELDKRLGLIDAELGASYTRSRVSVARLRFTLTPGDTSGDVATALAAAMKGDLRPAQYLASAGNPDVRSEFDISQSGRTVGAHAGLDLFGMSFYAGSEQTDADAVIQTPEGAMALVFDSRFKESGWFFTGHALRTTAIAGLILDARNPDMARSESNLVLSLAESDDFMEADKLLDHYDGLMGALAGYDAVAALEGAANDIQRYVEDNCPTDSAFNACRVDLQSSPMVMGLRDDAMAALEPELAGLEPDMRALVELLAEKRLDVQAVREYPAQWTGPASSVLVSYRMDDASMSALASANPDDLSDAIADYERLVEIDRGDDESRIRGDRVDIDSDLNRSAIRSVFSDFATRYRAMMGAEDTVLRGMGKVGPRALEIRFDVDSKNRPLYEDALVQSMARRRAQLVSDFVEDLSQAANGHRGTHISTYALLGMMPAGHRDVRVNYRVDTSDGWSSVNEPYRVAGYADFDEYVNESQTAPISSDAFDIDRFAEIE